MEIQNSLNFSSKIADKHFLLSTVGRKYIMGLTGLVWAGFVMGHMAGNLLVFVGPDAFNAYGHGITSGMAIYAIEAILLSSLVLHIASAVSLVLTNKTARDQSYAAKPKGPKAASLASRTMAVQGSLILAFVILHLITFKYGTKYETTVEGVKMRDLYRLMIEVFQQPGYVIWYLVCLVLLGFHLSHGVGSIFQSIGFTEDRHRPWIKKASWGYGLIVAAGFISQPLYVFFFVS